MEKERRIKAISVIALIVAVLGLTVAFAVLSTNLVINGTAKVEPGTWNIYFQNLSKANITGGAQVTGDATIKLDEPTKIEGINVTLTKPADKVTYTVELKNGGSIDAEISSINGPGINGDIANYIEFSARYSDDKEITKGDILKAGKTENVTISIKFKNGVTKLPDSALNIELSYEINYVQSEGKGDEHKAEISKPDYDSLTVGKEVTLATEEFYVMKNEVDKITLLSKYNLLAGNNVTFENFENVKEIDDLKDAIVTPMDSSVTGYGKQHFTAIGANLENSNWVGTIKFSEDNNNYCYWQDDGGNLKSSYGSKYPAYVYDNNSSIYDIVNNYKSYLESLGYKIKEARLMKIEELLSLGCEFNDESYLEGSCPSAPSWVYSTTYWLGTTVHSNRVSTVYHIGESGFIGLGECYLQSAAGIRPVIVLDKS